MREEFGQLSWALLYTNNFFNKFFKILFLNFYYENKSYTMVFI